MELDAKQKKYLIAGIIGVVTIAGAVAYLQYKKLMNYVLTFRSVKIKKIALDEFNFDLFFNLENKGDIGYEIVNQSYDVYLNDVFVTRLSNVSSTPIAANSISPLGLNIKFNPCQALNKLGFNLVTMFKGNDKLIITIDMKLKLKIWGIPLSIPYVYKSSLKDMMAA